MTKARDYIWLSSPLHPRTIHTHDANPLLKKHFPQITFRPNNRLVPFQLASRHLTYARIEQTRVRDEANVLRQPSQVELALYARAELRELVKGPN
jgi:hypothetical protein